MAFIAAPAVPTAPALPNPFGAQCGDALQVTFETCIRNVLTGPNGSSYTSAETFCQPYQQDQLKWYTCLCDKSTNVISCFTSSCPSDAGNMGSAANAKSNYCAAASAYSTTVSSSSTPTTGTATTSNNDATTGSTAAAPAQSTSSLKPAANSGEGFLKSGLELAVGLAMGALVV
ncbi:hypothetical protein BC830DRAFT_1163438 [Chytriomyces sp. MP71]|nr:hypothetical protein BC830DRAFT_1163438 [Chytriomyces sp. MP71]